MNDFTFLQFSQKYWGTLGHYSDFNSWHPRLFCKFWVSYVCTTCCINKYLRYSLLQQFYAVQANDRCRTCDCALISNWYHFSFAESLFQQHAAICFRDINLWLVLITVLLRQLTFISNCIDMPRSQIYLEFTIIYSVQSGHCSENSRRKFYKLSQLSPCIYRGWVEDNYSGCSTNETLINETFGQTKLTEPLWLALHRGHYKTGWTKHIYSLLLKQNSRSCFAILN